MANKVDRSKKAGVANNYYCIIMAGGLESRFWPISRNTRPKQFLDMLGTGRTFIQQTFDRFAQVIPTENILVVTSAQYKELVEQQLPLLQKENILLEPYRRNTAPCMAYATYKLLQKNPNASVVVTPSDHLITNESIFEETILNALDFASKNNTLITLGVKPNRPETAYGYIQMNKSSNVSINGNVAYNVKTFTEKPTVDLAEVFVNSGEFLWNSGIFIWNLKSIIGELEEHQNEMARLFAQGAEHYNTSTEQTFIEKTYDGCKNISIDYGIMEKTDKAVVYPVLFGWSDLGTWDALYSYKTKDSSGNHVSCPKSLLREVNNSIVISDHEKKVVVAAELDNFMVVNTEDLLLICPRDHSVYKTLFAEMSLSGLDKYL
ncbi:MAG: mannose-1-phosphate guanylyltransferase [Bacteroidales bacterium]